MSPTEHFFATDLPTLIVKELPRFRMLRGTLAFSCAGKKFTVCLGEAAAPIVPGFLRTADVKLWFLGDSFDRFLAGEPPPQVRIEGDVDVLERFGRLLLPAASSLSVRFAA
ncbi:MAG TPA: hypothetical protein VGO62_14685 [Myxococcota bacterium]